MFSYGPSGLYSGSDSGPYIRSVCLLPFLPPLIAAPWTPHARDLLVRQERSDLHAWRMGCFRAWHWFAKASADPVQTHHLLLHFPPHLWLVSLLLFFIRNRRTIVALFGMPHTSCSASDGGSRLVGYRLVGTYRQLLLDALLHRANRKMGNLNMGLFENLEIGIGVPSGWNRKKSFEGCRVSARGSDALEIACSFIVMACASASSR